MTSLDVVRARFARNEGLPFADVLTEANILDDLNEHGVTFRDRVFTPVTSIWGFLSQVLSEDHSCRDAVSRIIPHCAASHRPHMTLAGRTPDEVYFRLRPLNRQPRFEPRANWPRSAACAKPMTLIKGKPGVQLDPDIQFSGGRRHLPVVDLQRAA